MTVARILLMLRTSGTVIDRRYSYVELRRAQTAYLSGAVGDGLKFSRFRLFFLFSASSFFVSAEMGCAGGAMRDFGGFEPAVGDGKAVACFSEMGGACAGRSRR